MRVYLEAVEKVQGEEAEVSEGDFIRIDVSEFNEADALKDLMKLLVSGKKYVIQKHYCRHDEGGACAVEVLREV